MTFAFCVPGIIWNGTCVAKSPYSLGEHRGPSCCSLSSKTHVSSLCSSFRTRWRKTPSLVKQRMKRSIVFVDANTGHVSIKNLLLGGKQQKSNLVLQSTLLTTPAYVIVSKVTYGISSEASLLGFQVWEHYRPRSVTVQQPKFFPSPTETKASLEIYSLPSALKYTSKQGKYALCDYQ